ncbi:hypothetical protein BVG19_g369 [[Candida] boidinii]|nr:hypothetical protein BVG19_g369 [[Candida] boidinii]OWB49558.1 hypothetical protein B5S27_g1099 [[Candida] boidinii]OWB81899.1 hypothetical protein B5S33_g519 [[Candida] boidinii]
MSKDLFFDHNLGEDKATEAETTNNGYINENERNGSGEVIVDQFAIKDNENFDGNSLFVFDTFDEDQIQSISQKYDTIEEPPLQNTTNNKKRPAFFSTKKANGGIFDIIKKQKPATSPRPITSKEKSYNPNIKWQRYIGSLQVECWCTKSCFQGLNYGTEVNLSLTEINKKFNRFANILSKTHSNIYVCKIDDNREIGRINEKSASILSPFLKYDFATFNAYIIYSNEGKLRTGDTFIIQVDCYLNSNAFNITTSPSPLQNSSVTPPPTSEGNENKDQQSNPAELSLFFKSTDNVQTITPSESPSISSSYEIKSSNEIERKQSALFGLFNMVGWKPVMVESEVKILESSQTSISLDSDSEDDNIKKMTENVKSYDRENKENDDYFDDLKNQYNIENEKEKSQRREALEQQFQQSKILTLNELRNLYRTAQSNNLEDYFPETYPPKDSFKLDLRPYQRNGLSWLLKRESEYSLIGSNNPHITEAERTKLHSIKDDHLIDPLWREYKWPNKRAFRMKKNDIDPNEFNHDLSSFENDKLPNNFYLNLYSGRCSFNKPLIKLKARGGILADEMGLGKTISTLSLIFTVPRDLKYKLEEANNDTPVEPIDGLTTIQTPVINPEDKYAYQTTLIIVPMALLSQWESEFAKVNNDPANNKCFIYYGNDTLGNLAQRLCSKNLKKNPPPIVLLTTYGTVQSEFAKMNKSTNSNKNGLFSIKFFRIILDEGHIIRNKNIKTTKSILHLQSTKKWILTGTPIINRLDDLYSLINFLELEPWCNYSLWKHFITHPFETGKELPLAFNLLETILSPILLRRTKNQRDKNGELLVDLPKKYVVVENLKFNEKETVLYNWLKDKASITFQENLKKGTVLKNYSTILTQILRLRQVCCHIDLIKNNSTESLFDDSDGMNNENTGSNSDRNDYSENNKSNESQHNLFEGKDKEILQTLKNLEEEENSQKLTIDEQTKLINEIYQQYPNFNDVECSICTEPIGLEDTMITECKHCFCTACLMEHFNFRMSHIENIDDGESNGVNDIPNEVPTLNIDDDQRHKVLCPLCRSTIKKNRLFQVLKSQFKNDVELLTSTSQNEFPNKNYYVRPFNPYGPSSKINALLSHLFQIKEEEPNERIVVFSQFTSFLDLIEAELSKYSNDFIIYKFDGRLNLEARNKVLNSFKSATETDTVETVSFENLSENEISEAGEIEQELQKTENLKPRMKLKILLLSLKSGGVGLNLACASKGFMMDPYWTAQLQDQAIDRLHRVGQLRTVKVIQFIMEDSVEEKILKVQERKKQLGDAISIDDDERRKRKTEELQLLFGK